MYNLIYTLYTVNTSNDLRVNGERGIKDAIPPVFLVLEKERVLDQGWGANIAKWTVQTDL